LHSNRAGGATILLLENKKNSDKRGILAFGVEIR